MHFSLSLNVFKKESKTKYLQAKSKVWWLPYTMDLSTESKILLVENIGKGFITLELQILS